MTWNAGDTVYVYENWKVYRGVVVALDDPAPPPSYEVRLVELMTDYAPAEPGDLGTVYLFDFEMDATLAAAQGRWAASYGGDV